MKSKTIGEYYVWYCDWCDSRNLTPWERTGDGTVSCGECHKEHPVASGSIETQAQLAAASI